MKKIFKYIFLVLGCIHLTGGPYALVQSYAWATMLVDYSKNSSLAEAAIDTFSGEKPCSLCQKIDATKQDSPRDEAPLAPTLEKLSKEIFPITLATLADPASKQAVYTPFISVARSYATVVEAPPIPPPRA